MTVDPAKHVTVTGDEALDYAMDFGRVFAPIYKEEFGHCCDIGSFDQEPRIIEEKHFLWDLLLYRKNPEFFTLTFFPDRFGDPDWTKPVQLDYRDHEMPEYTAYRYTVNP